MQIHVNNIVIKSAYDVTSSDIRINDVSGRGSHIIPMTSSEMIQMVVMLSELITLPNITYQLRDLCATIKRFKSHMKNTCNHILAQSQI